MKVRLISFLCLVALVSISGLSPAAAALKSGDTCPKVGITKIAANGKGSFVCLTVSGARTWIFTPLPNTAGTAKRQINMWTATNAIPADSLARHHAQASDAYVQERLTKAQQAQDALINQKTLLTTQTTTLQSEIQVLPAQIRTAQSIAQTAESKLAGPRREYQSLSSQASSLSSQYGRLDTVRVSYLVCKIAEMFGKVGSGSCGTFNEANFLSIKSQYESANARAESAWQTYTVLYNDYKKKYDESVSLGGRYNTAQAELARAKADLGTVENSIPGSEAHLSASHAVIENLTNLKGALIQFDSANTRLRDLAAKPLGRNWKNSFNRIARLQGITSLHQKTALALFSTFRSQTGDLPDPQPTPELETTPTPDLTKVSEAPLTA